MEEWIDLAQCRQQWRNGLIWLDAGCNGGMDGRWRNGWARLDAGSEGRIGAACTDTKAAVKHGWLAVIERLGRKCWQSQANDGRATEVMLLPGANCGNVCEHMDTRKVRGRTMAAGSKTTLAQSGTWKEIEAVATVRACAHPQDLQGKTEGGARAGSAPH
eukprot:1120512-Pelagomonas_calceolata.AAC.1